MQALASCTAVASPAHGFITRPAAIAAGRCSRCRDGSGFVKHTAGRLHWGIPNLCFACDGEGTREAEIRKQAEVREARRIQDLYEAVAARRQRVIARAGGDRRNPCLAHRKIAYAFEGRTFTAAEYGQATGQSVEDAYVALCRWAAVHPIIDTKTGAPIGWQVG